MNWNFQELAATLRAQMASHPPVIVIKDDKDTDRKKIL